MRKKTISFDLSIKMLEQYYPGKDYHQAYKDSIAQAVFCVCF